jgi:hypothetical protein
MCYNLAVDLNSSSPPPEDDKAKAAHDWLLKEQHRLAEKVGEPIFVTIRLVYDGFIEVDVETFDGRQAIAGGDSLPETMAAAVETLLYLCEVVRDYQ